MARWQELAQRAPSEAVGRSSAAAQAQQRHRTAAQSRADADAGLVLTTMKSGNGDLWKRDNEGGLVEANQTEAKNFNRDHRRLKAGMDY
ncbi:hypothetical protein TRIUR3_19212 [Triticum urartu]|uniref:Uncharacterized protein n=1 Tax=Triticum urartu TaxID=4572 RepID=M8A2R0_TRIUA|nr:hypothetical protein TRIUR3_19212 [Triticum urartu]